MRNSFTPGSASLFLLLLVLSLQACSLGCSAPSVQPPVQPPAQPAPAASHPASVPVAVPAAAPSITAPAIPVPAVKANTIADVTEDQVLLAVSQSLSRSKLLLRPDPCYAYRFDPAAGRSTYTVDVRENHRHVECGGDPATQPHLFTVHVDKKTGAVSADSRSPGDFQPLKP